MKNWFMEKSIAVRAAIIVLAAAVVTAIGAGVYMIANRAGADNTSVANDTDASSTIVSPVIVENDEEEENETGNDETTTEVADVETKEVDELEFVDLSYQKTSNRLENGDFSDGLNAWEVYSYVADNIDYSADDYFSITMQETGTEDWHVQLKQNGIRLEKGKWYTISFDAKSTLGRSITCAMQRDGMIHNDDWTPYANAKAYTLTSNWKTYTYTFQMNENTDNASVFILSLGTINGRRITTEHTISVDNIKLVQLADNWTDALRVGDNLIGNADFSHGSTLWDASVVAPGAAQVSFDGNKATFDISNVGTVDWHVQLKQGGIKLANNQGYRLTFTVSSTTARTVKIGFMDTEYVNWYGGGDVYLNGTANQVVTVDFYNTLGANDNALFMLSMGLIEGSSTPAGKITLSDFKLVKNDSVTASSNGGGGSWSDPNHRLSNGWVLYDCESSHTNAVYESNGVVNVSITETGAGHCGDCQDWHVQLKNENISLENGKWYTMSYEVKSSIARNINVVIMRNGTNDDDWTTYSTGTSVKAVGTDWTPYSTTFQMTSASDAHAIYNFALGKVNGQSVAETHLVSIRNIKVEEVDAPVAQVRDIAVGDEVLDAEIKDGGSWGYYVDGEHAAGSINIQNGKFVAEITNCGDQSHYAQISQNGLNLESGAKYKVKLTVDASVARDIKVGFLTPANEYAWIGGSTISLDATSKEYSFEFIAERSHKQAMMTIDLGDNDQINGLPGTFKISGISVVKIADGPIRVTPENNQAIYMIDLAKYGVADPVGKDIKISVKIKSDDYFKFQITGESSSDYLASEEKESGDGSEVSLSYTITDYNKEARIGFWWMNGTYAEITDIKVSVVSPTSSIILTPVSNQVIHMIDFADYEIDNPLMRDFKITVKAKSDSYFKFQITGEGTGGYMASEEKESGDGSEITLTYTLTEYVKEARIGVWWSSGTYIEITELTVEDVTPVDKPVLIPIEHQVIHNIDLTKFGISNPAGKDLKITVSAKSDSYFKFQITGDGTSGYMSSEEKESGDGSEITITYTITEYTKDARIGVWWSEGTFIKVTSLTVEDVTPALVGAAFDDDAEVVGMGIDDEESEEGSILDSVEELIADPEDIIAEPEDFIVDGDLDDEDAAADIEADAADEAEAEEAVEEVVEESEVLEFIDLDA